MLGSTAEGTKVSLLNHAEILLVALDNAFKLLLSRSVQWAIIPGALHTSDGIVRS